MANTGRLTDIVRSRRSQGASVTGALAGGIKDRLKEKFDPRQLINQRGLLTALFPGLKAYQAKTFSSEMSKSSMQAASFDEIKPILETISYNTKMTAKNTMVLPALHRDVNVIRQNVIKMVKLKGGDARNKADMYFVKAKEREDKYERELKKERGKDNILNKLFLGSTGDDKKGFFGMLITAIKTGLKTLLNGISALGKIIVGAFGIILKTIIGAFQVIANVIVQMFSSLLSLLAGPLALIKTLLTDFIGLFFKKFLDFTKNKLLFSVFFGLLRGAVVGILNFLFSKNFAKYITRTALGVLVTLGVLGAADLYRRSNMYDDFLDENDKELKNRVQDTVEGRNKRRAELAKKSQLPSTMGPETLAKFQKEGLLAKGIQTKDYVSRAEGMPLDSKKMNMAILPSDSVEYMETDQNGYPTGIKKKDPSLLNDLAEKMVKDGKKLYQVLLPGFKDPVTLALTKEEAEYFGNTDLTYRMLLDALDAELEKSNPDKNKITSLIGRIKSLSIESGLIANQLVRSQYNKKHPEYEYITEALDNYVKQTNASAMDLIWNDIKSEGESLWNEYVNTPELEKESSSFIEEMTKSAQSKARELYKDVTDPANMLQLKNKLDQEIQSLKKNEFYDEMKNLIRQNYDAAKQGVKDAIQTEVNEVDPGDDNVEEDIPPASAINHSWFLADYDGMNEMFGYGGKGIYG